jgi:two-component system response regulator CiaR
MSKGVTILIVEDQALILLHMLAILGKGLPSARLLTAVDGADGLRQALAYHLDLIITDFDMPEMNGYQMLTALRRQRKKRIPVVGISAHDSAADDNNGFRTLCDAFLTKPLFPNDLLAKVFQLLPALVLL